MDHQRFTYRTTLLWRMPLFRNFADLMISSYLLSLCFTIIISTITDATISEFQYNFTPRLEGSVPQTNRTGISVFISPTKGQSLYFGLNSLFNNFRKLAISSVASLTIAYALTLTPAAKKIAKGLAVKYFLLVILAMPFLLSSIKCNSSQEYHHILSPILNVLPRDLYCSASSSVYSYLMRNISNYAASYSETVLLCSAIIVYSDFFASVIHIFYLSLSSFDTLGPIFCSELIFGTLSIAKLHFLYCTNNPILLLDATVHLIATFYILVYRFTISSSTRYSALLCCAIRAAEIAALDFA